MKVKEEVKQLRALEAGELSKKLKESEKELMHLQFKLASNQLQQTSQLTVLRRRVARIKTIQASAQS